jgi:hypothetical protein
MRSTFRPLAVLAVLLCASTVAYGQGVTTSLSGSVVDSSGGVIPGADVAAKNNATTAESRTVTSENGTFTIPALNPGVYTVTVTLTGFKTAVLATSSSTRNAGLGARAARGGPRRNRRRRGERNRPDAVASVR